MTPGAIILVDDVVQEGAKIPPSIASFRWDWETTLPDGTVLRSNGNMAMISTPLREDWIK